jgi:hypothetical protein
MDTKFSSHVRKVLSDFSYLTETSVFLGNDLTNMLLEKARACRILPSCDLDDFEFCCALMNNTRFITYLRNSPHVHDVVKDYVNAPNFYEFDYADIYGLGFPLYYGFYKYVCPTEPFSYICHQAEKRASLNLIMTKLENESNDPDFFTNAEYFASLEGKRLLKVLPTSKLDLTCASADISGTFEDFNSLIGYIKDTLGKTHFTGDRNSIEFLVSFDCSASLEAQIHNGKVKVLTSKRKYQSLTSIVVNKCKGDRSYTASVKNTLTNAGNCSLCKDIFSSLL